MSTMLEDLAEVIDELRRGDCNDSECLALANRLTFTQDTIAQNAKDSKRLKALVAMRNRWADDDREYLNRVGQHLPASLACLIDQFDDIMRGEE